MTTKEKVMVTDPGDLTVDELAVAVENQNRIPFWAMHPLAQHYIRMSQIYRPETVESQCDDDSDWVPNRMNAGQMFLERYRIQPDTFDQQFLNGHTNVNSWKYRSRKSEICLV